MPAESELLNTKIYYEIVTITILIQAIFGSIGYPGTRYFLELATLFYGIFGGRRILAHYFAPNILTHLILWHESLIIILLETAISAYIMFIVLTITYQYRRERLEERTSFDITLLVIPALSIPFFIVESWIIEQSVEPTATFVISFLGQLLYFSLMAGLIFAFLPEMEGQGVTPYIIRNLIHLFRNDVVKFIKIVLYWTLFVALTLYDVYFLQLNIFWIAYYPLFIMATEERKEVVASSLWALVISASVLTISVLKEQTLMISYLSISVLCVLAIISIMNLRSKYTSTKSERDTLQTTMLHNQTNNVLGQLAGGLAHEFNNILQVIQGNVELLHIVSHKEKILETIEEQLETAMSLTGELLGLSRRNPGNVEELDVNKEITRFTRLAGKFLVRDVQLITHLDATGAIRMNRQQLFMIMLNLVKNSVDAVGKDGLIVIQTREIFVKNREPYELPTGKYVEVGVRDNGHGIPMELQSKIFEPYFTTKNSDVGTGYGLALVQSILKMYDALITFNSTVGEGTEMTMVFKWFPPGGEMEELADLTNACPLPSKVLLLDDNKQLLDTLKSQLKMLGYEVSAVSTTEEAKNKLHSEKISLFISDIILGKENGISFAAEVRAQHPRLPIVLMSGYQDIDETITIPLDPFTFIQKPFRTIELLNKIHLTACPMYDLCQRID